MANTIAQIAERVLRDLGRLPEGQTATASQKSQVEVVYDEIYQELLDDGLVNWLSTDNIPDNVTDPIKIMLLERLAPSFGVPNQWAGMEKTQIKRISRVLASPYVRRSTDFEDF